MAQYTQKAILSTFEQMLEEMPFDKITVSALVRRCEISSNTFYYHYSDIYNLLGVWIRGELDRFVDGRPPFYDWKKAMKDFLHACEARSNIIYHIFNSLSRERVERFVFSLSDDVFYRSVCTYAMQYAVPEEKLSGIAEICRISFAGFFLRFIWSRMKDDIDPMVDSYATLLEEMVTAAIEKYPKKG